jgi:1,4-dihydroxy-6-naphthoate synthase
MDERVTRDHIALYVNDFSVTLGREGTDAVMVFLARGRAAGILPDSARPVFLTGR